MFQEIQSRIKIHKKKPAITASGIIKFMILFVLIMGMFESLGAPHVIAYILDICTLFLFVALIGNRTIRGCRYPLFALQFLMIAVGVCVAIINRVEFPLVVWSIRAYGRFLVFFLACINFLDRDDVLDIIKLLENMFYFDILLMILQYMLGVRQDNLGGIFGTDSGVNASNNILAVIVCSLVIARWFAGQERTIRTAIVVIAAVGVALLAETKVFLFELIVIVVVELVVCLIVEHKRKYLISGGLLLILAVALLIAGASVIAILYPNKSNSDFLSIEGLRYILMRDSGYSGAGDLNRLTAIKTINQLPIFGDSFINQLFGMGQGAAEYSASISFLQSDFYNEYQYLRYYWFSHAWIYLENGLLGLVLYVIAMFSDVIYGIRHLKLSSDSHDYIFVAAIAVSVVSLVLCIYNQSLRKECAYMLYLIFAAMFIQGRVCDDNKRTSINKSAGS